MDGCCADEIELGDTEDEGLVAGTGLGYEEEAGEEETELGDDEEVADGRGLG